jgi:copper oxidase (laccase) domain-containing protein
MSNTKERMINVGESNLTGWRGAAGRAIAKPVAKHTRFTQRQVEAAIGLALLGYAVYRLGRPMVAAFKRT